jgi:hypothetical protein
MNSDKEPEIAVTPLNSFADVQNFITKVLTDNREIGDVPNSPHKAFWKTSTYDEFVNGSVPGVTDPATGQPIPILVKGNSTISNLILSLQGKGPLFDPTTGSIGQMPADGPPIFTDDQIMSIAQWIDAGCPK